jgi:hypothetical protein
MTPCHVAAKKNFEGAFKELAMAGANLETINNEGEKPIDLATRPSMRRLVEACVRDARYARFKKEQERIEAERKAREEEEQRIKNIETKMGLVEVMDQMKVGSIHDADISLGAKLRRLVKGRSERSAALNPHLVADDASGAQGATARGRRSAIV